MQGPCLYAFQGVKGPGAPAARGSRFSVPAHLTAGSINQGHVVPPPYLPAPLSSTPRGQRLQFIKLGEGGVKTTQWGSLSSENWEQMGSDSKSGIEF